jgi:cell division protein FtsB
VVKTPVNYSKLILGFYAALFVGVALWAATFFVQMQRDLTTLRLQESAGRRRLEEAQARLQEQEKYLDRLQHDPALVERIIRQKLGYARSQEFVFRFEEAGNRP